MKFRKTRFIYISTSGGDKKVNKYKNDFCTGGNWMRFVTGVHEMSGVK